MCADVRPNAIHHQAVLHGQDGAAPLTPVDFEEAYLGANPIHVDVPFTFILPDHAPSPTHIQQQVWDELVRGTWEPGERFQFQFFNSAKFEGVGQADAPRV